MGRQLGHKLLGILGSQVYRKPRLRGSPLSLREQRNDPADDCCALVALADPAAVVGQQAVEPALVVGGSEKAAEAR